MEAGITTPEITTETVSGTVAKGAPEAPLPEKSSTILLLASGAALTALLGISLAFSTPQEQEVVVVPTLEAPTVQEAGTFSGLDLQAKAAFVYDITADRVLFAHNEAAQLPLASLTKLMTAIVATESLAYDTIVAVSPQDLEAEGDSGLYVDEQWRARDLLDFMLLVSSNDSAHVLAATAGAAVVANQTTPATTDSYSAFIERMNTKAQEIGLAQTYFLNETGLDANENVSGGYGSAQDMAHLLAYALKNTPDALDATSYPSLTFTSQSNISHTAENTNEITASIPGLIASKTGYTTLAGGNLVIAFDAGVGRPIVVSVLGSTREGRFEDVEKLVAATLTSLQSSE